MSLIICHNNRCSKSREAMALLESTGIPFEVRYYLEQPFSTEELHDLLRKLGMSPEDLLRRNEPLYKELKATNPTAGEWLTLMAANPQLIERPIVINGDKAVIARPAERLKTVL